MPGGCTADAVDPRIQLLFSRLEEFHNEEDRRKNVQHSILLGERRPVSGIRNPHKISRADEQHHSQIREKSRLTMPFQKHKDHHCDHTILNQPEQTQRYVHRNPQHRSQVIQHAVHPHRINTCNVNVIFNQSIDPVVVYRNVRSSISPVMQNPRPADFPHQQTEDHKKGNVQNILLHQTP